MLDVFINVFFWCNKTASRSSFFDCRSFLKNWRCGASIPVPLACETIALLFELHPRWGNCQRNSWTEFSIAYRSSFGYVDAGHQSVCFSHANALPFRLSRHAGLVQGSSLCQREVFDSHVSRTVFSSTSLWGKHWRFGAPIALSASTTVSDASLRILDVLINVFVGLTKPLPVDRFIDCRSFLKNWRCGASIPVPLACETIALLFELHPRWGNCQRNSWTEFSIAYRSSFGYVDAGHQSVCFSHANALPFRLSRHAGLIQGSSLCQREVFDSHVSRTVFSSTSLWGKHWRFGAPIALSASTTVSDASLRILDVLINVFFGLTKPLRVDRFLIAGIFWKVGDAGHPSLFLSPAKRALYFLSYIPVEKTCR